VRILVVGATGAVGRPLIRQLREHGHEVVGTTRSAGRADRVEALGARAVICDALDAGQVETAVHEVQPEVIVNQLTALSAPINPRRYAQWLEPTNELRRVGTRNLAAAAQAAGTPRLVSQSIAFAYDWDGAGLRTEADPLMRSLSDFRPAVEALDVLETTTLSTPGLAGTVLRYGYFYGPGTSYASDGDVAQLVRKRRFPIVGAGTGVFSLVHVEDAAAATVAVIEQEIAGTFNVVDDDPAPMHQWLPLYAEAVGAPRPFRVPLWLARLASSRFIAEGALRLPGASNARARKELGWAPQWSSWREGFRRALG
jgi:nucleoside-diphosphate-sugar epimerase